MISTILIIGGGQAGAQAIDTLRREGYGGRVVLIGDEPELPYQRPPLSKKYLAGEMAADRLLFRHRAFYDEHRIELKLGRQAVRLDAAARQVELADGEKLTYDRLLLCLGAESRRLTCPGATLAGVHYLRSLGDVAPIQAGFKAQARVVIIGGGYIGLETAATCRKMGCEVTVLEMADRVMNRVVAPSVSQYFAEEHRAHGVTIICDTRVDCLEGRERVEHVVCADGTRHAADLVIVGVGAVATTELASAAGLACDNGIVVDEYCRTSDAAIYAAGDCTNHPSLRFGRRVRLESVDNAFEQAKTAALNLLDKPVPHDRVPRPGSGPINSTTSCSSSDSRRITTGKCCGAIQPRAASASAISRAGNCLRWKPSTIRRTTWRRANSSPSARRCTWTNWRTARLRSKKRSSAQNRVHRARRRPA